MFCFHGKVGALKNKNARFSGQGEGALGRGSNDEHGKMGSSRGRRDLLGCWRMVALLHMLYFLLVMSLRLLQAGMT